MNATQSARGYDRFKLVVALILLALFIILLLLFRGLPAAEVAGGGEAAPPTAAAIGAAGTQSPAQPLQPENTAPPAAAELPADTAEPTAMPTVMPTAMPTATSTAPATPTATLEPTATLAPTPTTEPTQAAEPAAAAEEPAPTEPAAATPTGAAAPPAGESTGDLAACAALPSRLAVGETAEVLTNLHFRASPGIEDNLIRVHLPGTRLEVVGGPQCIPYAGSAYLWWELRHADGTTGWSAEGSASGGSYFLQPVE